MLARQRCQIGSTQQRHSISRAVSGRFDDVASVHPPAGASVRLLRLGDAVALRRLGPRPDRPVFLGWLALVVGPLFFFCLKLWKSESAKAGDAAKTAVDGVRAVPAAGE